MQFTRWTFLQLPRFFTREFFLFVFCFELIFLLLSCEVQIECQFNSLPLNRENSSVAEWKHGMVHTFRYIPGDQFRREKFETVLMAQNRHYVSSLCSRINVLRNSFRENVNKNEFQYFLKHGRELETLHFISFRK